MVRVAVERPVEFDDLLEALLSLLDRLEERDGRRLLSLVVADLAGDGLGELGQLELPDRLHEDELVPRGHAVLGPESLESLVVVHDGRARSLVVSLVVVVVVVRDGGKLVLGATATTQTV